jgi:polysaccharide biosynthesis/export protein
VIGCRGMLPTAVLLAMGQALGGCAGSPPPAGAATAAHAAGSDYLIGPGDTLSVFVYREPELSVPDLPVRPDGRISVPLVADIAATGRTPSQLADEITGRLKRYVNDPNVTVMVRSFIGPLDRQIRVIGEAMQPLALPYRDHLTVLDVMLAAKGLTKYAAGNRAEIIRSSGGRQEIIRVHLSDLLRDGDISQNVPMQPGDTLIIPQTWF